MLEQRVEHSIKTNMRTEAHVRHNRTIEKPQPTEEDKKNAPPTAFIYMYVVRVYQYMKIESAAAKKKNTKRILLNKYICYRLPSFQCAHSLCCNTHKQTSDQTTEEQNQIRI